MPPTRRTAFRRPADQRGLQIFPHQGAGAFAAASYEDDGETANGPNGAWRLDMSDAEQLRVTVERRGVVASNLLILIFPAGEARAIVVSGGDVAEERLSDGRRQVRVAAAPG